MTSQPQNDRSTRRGSASRSLARLAALVQFLLVLAALGVTVYIAVPFIRAASKPKPAPKPVAMEAVDWSSPDSSQYCLACHKELGPAMGGLDVEQGHPHNVPLNAAQLKVVQELGTIVGAGGTLICTSCHKLGTESSTPYMLADTLMDSRLCVRCHPTQVSKCDTRHDLRRSAPDERNRLGETADQGGPCSACHLAHHYARDFEPCSLDPDGRCVPCHKMQGCAGQLGEMRVDHPVSRCVECHNPHDSCEGRFLREGDASLCLTCHPTLQGGIAAGMHPLGPMDGPIPQDLVDAGAQVSPDGNLLTCVVCHSTHRANSSSLLVMPVDSDRLCLACHQDNLQKKNLGGKLTMHGRSPTLNANQQAVVKKRGGVTGPQGQLVCGSCHQGHGAEAGTPLLNFDPKYDDTCGACHPQTTMVAGTPHDLRTNFPDEKNLAGQVPLTGGACSACHMAHQPGRKPAPTAGDPSGQCIACHQPGACGQAKLTGSTDHPGTMCTDCHNPHQNKFGKYLVAPAAELCKKCHEKESHIIGGPHDVSRKPAAWPKAASAAASGGPCLSCHLPHGDNAGGLFRFAAGEGDSYHDGVCLTCHPNAAWKSQSDVAAIHPHDIHPDQKKVELALVPKDNAGNMRMGCRTCHDPHGGTQPVHLARVAPGQPTESLCLHCHAEKQYIRLTGHSSERLAKAGFDVDSCKPCHAMHANPSAAWGQMLSPRFLGATCQPGAKGEPDCVPCEVCHQPGGPAPVRAVVTHPEVAMTNVIPRDAPGYMPLFNEQGREDPKGQVVCRTCHLSHGRLDLLKLVSANPSLTAGEQRAVRMQLRDFVPPNICTECHGFEARLRFLFYHNPEKRKEMQRGPAPAGTPQPTPSPEPAK
jgi:predicted CXXCH cytochrome family protein